MVWSITPKSHLWKIHHSKVKILFWEVSWIAQKPCYPRQLSSSWRKLRVICFAWLHTVLLKLNFCDDWHQVLHTTNRLTTIHEGGTVFMVLINKNKRQEGFLTKKPIILRLKLIKDFWLVVWFSLPSSIS